MRVLIADDNRDTVLTLGILLRSEGYEVRLVQNGTDALTVAEQFQPDVALLDIHMPGRTGLEVAQELVRRRTKCPILVAVSAHAGASTREMAEISGFDHFIAKPYDPQALLLLLDSFSESSGGEG